MSKLITKCEMDWEMERHKFTFHTGGSQIEALDSLNDLIGSLKDLYKHLANAGSLYEDGCFPSTFKVKGGCNNTYIKAQKYLLEITV